MKYLQPQSVYSRIGWFLCVLEAIMVYVQVVIMIPVTFLDPTIAQSTEFMYVLTIFSYYMVAFPMFMLCMSTLEGKSKKEKKTLSVVEFLILFLISFAVMNGTNLINVAFTAWFHMMTGKELGGNLDGVFSEPTLLMFVMTVILAPIFEELTFRYFALNKLRKYGDKAAIFTTAILFGLFHMNFEQFIYATALGIVFGYIVCRTGRVQYTMLLHALVNFFGGYVAVFMEKIENPAVILGYSAVYYLMVLLGIILLIVYRKRIKLNPGTERVRNPIRTAIANPGMLVFGITSIILMIMTLAMQIFSAFFS